jgi:hypothetical protein
MTSSFVKAAVSGIVVLSFTFAPGVLLTFDILGGLAGLYWLWTRF